MLPTNRGLSPKRVRLGQKWRMAALLTCMLASQSAALAAAEVPLMPKISVVPPSGKEPLSSANRPGTEYADLAKAGYVEEEYYLYGEAPAITASGETLLQAPYITRILVRKPKDPARFNGTVVIAPFTWIGERGADWILTSKYLMRKGYAWVGYTLNINKPDRDPKTTTDPEWNPDPEPQNLNFDFMRRFDYARYAPLGTYYDPKRFLRGGLPDAFVPQSQGIGAQLALLLKSNRSDGPLPGLKVERVYVNSWAVTAQVWFDYVDQGRHAQWRMPDGRPLVDAYMTGKMNWGGVGGEVIRRPRRISDDVLFVTIYSQSETSFDAKRGIAPPEDSDRPRLRFYELLGVPHIRTADLGTDNVEDFAADVGKQDDPKCIHLYDEPSQVLASALLDNMDRWVRDGKAMARAPIVRRQGTQLYRNPKSGNWEGGVRPPWISVPAASYMVEDETKCGLVYDTKIPFDAQRLRTMYGTYANYLRKFEAAKKASVAEGYLLAEDADSVKPVAKPADFEVKK